MHVGILETRDTKNRFKSNAGFNGDIVFDAVNGREIGSTKRKGLRSEYRTNKFGGR